jgi:prepilin-type N-terminal cleavage/methylation domain-containing protein
VAILAINIMHNKRLTLANSRGFTFIEMLVVITIIALLTAIGMVSFARSGVSARNSKRKADIETVRQAFVLSRADGNLYPNNSMAFTAAVTTLITNGYLSAPVPTDPKNPTSVYSYTGVAAGTSFCICAVTETIGGTTQGNSSAIGSNGACSFGTGAYYCAQNP